MKQTTAAHPIMTAVLLLFVLAIASSRLTSDYHPAVTVNALDMMSYTVRPDYRKCVSPWCGGFWLKAVNSKETSTKCGDGTEAEECYITGFGFSTSLEYNQDEKALFQQQVADGGIVCGSYAPHLWSNAKENQSEVLFTLVVSAGWSRVSL